MRTVKTAPGANRLIESLRSMGYECATAMADIIDNSISAGAKNVQVYIHPQKGTRPPCISIVDDGSGMDAAKLVEAMRFGAFQEYANGALGKYGLGLKTASLSQCRKLTVATRKKGQRKLSIARWDLDHVGKTDEWDLLMLDEYDLLAWERELLDGSQLSESGTIVLWSSMRESMPLLEAEDLKERQRFLDLLTGDVSLHLRMVFHRFLQGAVPGRKKVKIRVGDADLRAWDPFCSDEPATKRLPRLNVKALVRDRGQKKSGTQSQKKSEILVQPYIVPREDQFSSPQAWREASGPNGWNQQQGFYFYRNHRLVKAGGWSYLRSLDEHTKLLRIAVDFTSELDQSFSIDITKMKALVPADIKDEVRAKLTEWIRAAKETYAATGGRPDQAIGAKDDTTTGKRLPASGVSVGPLTLTLSNSPSPYFTVVKGTKPGHTKVIVPAKHDCALMFDRLMDGEKESRLGVLCMTLLGIIEAASLGRISFDDMSIENIRREVMKTV